MRSNDIELRKQVEGHNGPGKLTKALVIDRSLNGESFITSDKIWIEDDGYICEFHTGRRVGINYATPEYIDIPWRFTMD